MKYLSRTILVAGFTVTAVAFPLSISFADMANVNTAVSVGERGEPQQNQRAGPMGWISGDKETLPRPTVVGTVSKINGDTIIVVQGAHRGFGSSTPAMETTTFTVNAANATVLKNNATSTVSSIVIGDMVAVQGTVNGTNVTATTIRDGFAGDMMGERRGIASSTRDMPSPITGNGQPIIAGTINAINGSSLTITNKSATSYTIDASNAKIVEGQNTVTVSNLSVGDSVIVQGTINGTSVVASSVIDQKSPGAKTASSTSRENPRGGNVFEAIGNFFSRLFGF